MRSERPGANTHRDESSADAGLRSESDRTLRPIISKSINWERTSKKMTNFTAWFCKGIRRLARPACVCGMVGGLFALPAGADPELTPDAGVAPGAITTGVPDDGSIRERALKLDYSNVSPSLRIVLPPPSEKEKQSMAKKGGKGPVAIGFHRDPPLDFRSDLSPQLDWVEHSDGSLVSSLTVTSPGAQSVRVGIRAVLAPGAEIRFFREASDRLFPVITGEDFHTEGDELETLWSPTVEGDTIGIEITLPSDKAMTAFSLTLEAVAHTLVPTESLPLAPKLDCPHLHIDVACRSGSIHGNKQSAVARIRYEDDGKSYVCSGTLLNDLASSAGISYFLTANHCVATGSVARTVEAWWFYRAASCGSSTLDSRFTATTDGTDLLTTNLLYDLSLLRFRRGLPRGLVLSGWSTRAIDHPASVYGIHHPDGDWKSYSAGTTRGNRLSDGVVNAIAVTWSEGTTEGGSSGSGLFLRDGGHLVGGLSRGPDCGFRITDHYGPFRDFFPQSSRWLDPAGAQPIPADDHGNTASSATLVRAPSSTAGVLERYGDRDYFRFSVSSAGALQVHSTGSTDTVGTLTRSSSSFRQTDDDGGQGPNFSIAVPDAPAGTYYVEVRGYDGTRTGVYTLHVASSGTSGSPEHVIPLVLPASNAGMEGFVRIINRTSRAGNVRIIAIDDTGRRFAPISLSLALGETAHFNSTDLERGNPAKGLSGGTGKGSGNWRLELSSELDIEALAYVRTTDGFLTSIHEVAEESAGSPLRYQLPFFNPASNRANVSLLRLVNLADAAAAVTISASDDLGDPAPGGSVRLTLPARAARMLSAQELEAGTARDVQGRLGDGVGKWKLSVSANRPLQVMSVMRTASGNLTNLTR